MASRNQNIKIVVHTPQNFSMAFRAEDVQDFWMEKISGKIKESDIKNQELQRLLKNTGAKEYPICCAAWADKRMSVRR